MASVLRAFLVVFLFVSLVGSASAACPSADLTGDCVVDFADLAALAGQWMADGSGVELAAIPEGTCELGEDGAMVTVEPFRMGRYEVTASQYCRFLNDALREGMIAVLDRWPYKPGSERQYPYCRTSTTDSRIDYADGLFTVRVKGGRTMSRDPMGLVSWYGAVAYCNWLSEQEGLEPCYDLETWECDLGKDGYRLPGEAEWLVAARGGLSGLRFPWGDTIHHAHANYIANPTADSFDTNPYTEWATHHPAWSDGDEPYTSPVGSFLPNGYGLYDVVGNVWEWCNDYREGGRLPYYIFRGGSWNESGANCRLTYSGGAWPDQMGDGIDIGFRVCRSWSE